VVSTHFEALNRSSLLPRAEDSPVHTGKIGRKTRKAITEKPDVQNGLKIHIKLNLDVDILVVAKIKRNIVIGILKLARRGQRQTWL
jgi:hypothetical protein